MAGLPGASFGSWEWQEAGLCRERDEFLFVGPDREGTAARRRRERRAKAVCGACPVLARCRSHALSVPEPHGVWGGLTEHERACMTQPLAQGVTGAEKALRDR